jgi:hypothetical protein
MENNLFQQITFLSTEFTQMFFPFFTSQTLEVPSSEPPRPKSRGRKKLRPGNPLKTEVLDKYWLRAFKNFVKGNYFELKTVSKDKEFWNWYFAKGKPGKNGEYLSYNSQYKQRLFGNPSFCAAFAAWGIAMGGSLKPKKSLKASWEFYFNYFFQELIPYSSSQADMEDFGRFQQFICEKMTSGLKTLKGGH